MSWILIFFSTHTEILELSSLNVTKPFHGFYIRHPISIVCAATTFSFDQLWLSQVPLQCLLGTDIKLNESSTSPTFFFSKLMKILRKGFFFYTPMWLLISFLFAPLLYWVRNDIKRHAALLHLTEFPLLDSFIGNYCSWGKINFFNKLNIKYETQCIKYHVIITKSPV